MWNLHSAQILYSAQAQLVALVACMIKEENPPTGPDHEHDVSDAQFARFVIHDVASFEVLQLCLTTDIARML